MKGCEFNLRLPLEATNIPGNAIPEEKRKPSWFVTAVTHNFTIHGTGLDYEIRGAFGIKTATQTFPGTGEGRIEDYRPLLWY